MTNTTEKKAEDYSQKILFGFDKEKEAKKFIKFADLELKKSDYESSYSEYYSTPDRWGFKSFLYIMAGCMVIFLSIIGGYKLVTYKAPDPLPVPVPTLAERYPLCQRVICDVEGEVKYDIDGLPYPTGTKKMAGSVVEVTDKYPIIKLDNDEMFYGECAISQTKTTNCK